MELEVTVGLEAHVQIKTQTKLFCGCANEFGAPPNTHICPICTGMPGVLPVFNRAALHYGIRAALSLDCEICENTKFDRKNYFYPDLPKGYQISQYDLPYARNGKITLMDGSVIRIHRIHIEEDAGKTIHDRGPFSLVDLNRAGVPLLECVSEPDIRSPEQATEYLHILKQTMQYAGVSDCDMEKGSLRCDVNVSLAPQKAKQMGTKVEIKNLNSFRHIAKALEYEIARQSAMLSQGEKIVQETRLWKEAENKTVSMRSKEEAHDYRYFPEPDLPPLKIDKDFIQQIRKELPELPAAKIERFQNSYRLNVQESSLLAQNRALADYFEETAKLTGNPKSACNWISSSILETLNTRGIMIEQLPLSPAAFADLIRRVDAGELNVKSGKKVFAEMIETGKEAKTLIEELGLSQISDTHQIENFCREAIQALPKAVEQFRGGKERAIDSLVGKVMGATGGRANPSMVQEILRRLILEEKR